jgi:hypothetical protein
MNSVNSIGGGNVLVLILVLSFAIDRVVAATFFLLSYLKPWQQWFPDPLCAVGDPVLQARYERNQHLLRTGFAVAIALLIAVLNEHVRLLAALGIQNQIGIAILGDAVDIFITTIVLVAGSDVLGRLMDISGRGMDSQAAQSPIEITGTLVLKDEAKSGDSAGGDSSKNVE